MAGTVEGRRQFCWICDMEDPLWKCQTCPRSFHVKCAFNMPGYPNPILGRLDENSDREEELVQCPQCLVGKTTTVENFKNLSMEALTKIFTHLCLRIRKMFDVNPFIDLAKAEGPDYVETIAKLVDVQTLEGMITRGEITTAEGFMGEIRWIRHNTVIFHGRTSPFLKRVNEILTFCSAELNDCMKCPTWYINMMDSSNTDFFVQPCDPPHILAWSKLVGYQWWPSKITKITGDTVSIIFFGDHSSASLPIQNCFMYSKNPPTNSKVKASAKFKKAVKEAEEHIEALRKTYGRVTLAKDYTSLMPEITLEGILPMMFPDYVPKPPQPT